jgi:uncharacterized membrane protein YjjB (DUF3815 family)
MANNRPPKTHLYAAATSAGGAQVYRQTPSPAGATTTLPTAGAVPAVDCWAEVYEHGAQTPTHVLVAKAGVPALGVLMPTTGDKAGLADKIDAS